MFSRISLLFLLLVLCSPSFTQINSSSSNYQIDPGATIVIIDAGNTNTPGIAITKKRQEIVEDIKQRYIPELPSVIQHVINAKAIIDTTLSSEEKTGLVKKDSSAFLRVIEKYKGGVILLLRFCDGGFRKDDVKKSKNSDGSTTRTADYSVYFDTYWTFYFPGMIREQTITTSKHHSSRKILSGLLARGPGYSANKEYIEEMAQLNARDLAFLFR